MISEDELSMADAKLHSLRLGASSLLHLFLLALGINHLGQSTLGVSFQTAKKKNARKWPSSNAARVFEGFLESPTPPLFKISYEPTGNILSSTNSSTLH